MARPTVAGLFAFANFLIFAAAQTGCFWPDGTSITNTADSTPCTSDNSGDHLGTSNSMNTCCPTGWQCLSNGLCQNPTAVDNQLHSAAGLYGRYGCTDNSFQGCTNACLATGMSGAEALLQCNPNRWCCDGDRTSGNCCDQALPGNSPQYFGLSSSGQVVAAGGSGGSGVSTSSSPPDTSSVPPTSSEPPSSSEPPPTSSSLPASTSSSDFPSVDSQTPTSSPTPSEPPQVSTSVSTNAGGAIVTEFVTTTPTAEPSGGSSSNTGLIVGCAVGIPVGLALIGAIIFFLWRRRRRAPVRAESPPLGISDEPYTDDYKHGPNAQILGAAGLRPGPVGGPYEADSKPVSINNKDPKEAAELHSDSASPAMGSSTGQSGTPAPPYSAKFAQDNPRSLAELPAQSLGQT